VQLYFIGVGVVALGPNLSRITVEIIPVQLCWNGLQTKKIVGSLREVESLFRKPLLLDI